jgi:hypothetical protein
MNQTKRSKLVLENDANYGTFLIPVNGIPSSECKLLENVYHGNASIFKPHKNSEAEEEEPTILIIRNEETHREISLSLQEPQTICGRAMIGQISLIPMSVCSRSVKSHCQTR